MRKVILVGWMMVMVMSLSLFATNLVVRGSNTVYPITQLWLEAFKEMDPEVVATLEGAGSSTGIRGLFNETTDIANSSRFLSAREIEDMNQAGRYFVPLVIAYDGIAVVVNKSNPIEEISLETLKAIYTGTINNWNQIDPSLPSGRIAVFSRSTASGTYETWSEKVLLNERMHPSVQVVESTQAEVENIRRNVNSIAYIGLGYVTDELKVLRVNGISCTVDNVLTGLYPISRPLFMFFDLKPFGFKWPDQGVVSDFITFALSPKGQALVAQAGYIPAYGDK